VLRSLDGRSWQPIGFVSGAGNTEEVQQYRYLDHEPQRGVNYYRLRQLDLDGGFDYSEVRSIRFDQQLLSAEFFPNPTQGQLSVRVSGGLPATLWVSDMTGRVVMKRAFEGRLEIDLGDQPLGLYALKVETGQQIFSETVIKK
jgi:hypothetical protein